VQKKFYYQGRRIIPGTKKELFLPKRKKNEVFVDSFQGKKGAMTVRPPNDNWPKCHWVRCRLMSH
jgi:hypothetical protein